MRYSHHLTIGISIFTALFFVSATEALAQVCLGLPSGEGQISLQGEVSASTARQSVGGRLGLNFNTEYSLGFAASRPEYDAGRGLSLSGQLAYEMEDYAPPICFTIGVRHDRLPVAESNDSTLTMVPIGLGIGKRLGSARGLSLGIYIMPEYLYVAKPRPEGEYESFWDELGVRSHGRGVIGELVATPFIFATGRVEISTLDNYNPMVTLGLGLIF
jgi:hypothetical protein